MTLTPLLAITLACCLASAWWNLKRAIRPAGAVAERLLYLTVLSFVLGVGALAHVFLFGLLIGPFPALDPFVSALHYAEIVVPAVAASVLSLWVAHQRAHRETVASRRGSPR